MIIVLKNLDYYLFRCNNMDNSDFNSELAIFYEGGNAMKYIYRHAEKLVSRSEKTFKTVLLTGARQTGKSTLYNEMFKDMSSLTFDDEFLEEQARENPNEFLSLNEPPIIMDEIQYVPQLFRYIKMECDKRKKNGLYLLTGSQPFKLMELASESLAGRVAIIEMPPLSLREIMNDRFDKPFIPTTEYIKERRASAQNPGNIWNVIHRGGYPEIQNPDMDWQTFYSSYIKTYLERDVRSLSAVHNLDTFRRFMIACAARTGSCVNYTNIADELSISADTVKNWMSILEASGIVYMLEPFTHSALNRAIKSPKLYFRDTGLASYLTRWTTADTLASGAMSGNIFETFVVSEILKSYSNAGMDYRYSVTYYRGKDKGNESEIDLIIEQDGRLYPIEIKKKEKPVASDAAAFTLLDKVKEKERGTGAIVCMCSAPGILRDNLNAIPAWYI